MASNASPEANEIRRRGRRRLIGAIALVMLLVVFVPMVLDSEPRPARNEPATRIPPRDSAPPLPAPPAAVAPAPSAAPAKVGAQSAAPTAEVPKAAAPARPDAAVVEPVKPQAETPAKVADAAKLQGFAVQVGAFRDEAKLKQSREKLAAAGVVHYTERLDSKAGPLTRLRAGPFATRAEAEAALVKLKRATIDGKVVALP